jgi:hypothetical protein
MTKGGRARSNGGMYIFSSLLWMSDCLVSASSELEEGSLNKQIAHSCVLIVDPTVWNRSVPLKDEKVVHRSSFRIINSYSR